MKRAPTAWLAVATNVAVHPGLAVAKRVAVVANSPIPERFEFAHP